MQLLPLSPWREAVDIEAELVVRLRCKAMNNRKCAFLMVEMLDASANQGASVHVVVEVARGRGGLRGFIPGLGSSDKLTSKTLQPFQTTKEQQSLMAIIFVSPDGSGERSQTAPPPTFQPECGR